MPMGKPKRTTFASCRERAPVPAVHRRCGALLGPVLASILVTWAGPARADGSAVPLLDPPPEPVETSRSTRALWIPGLVTLATTYVAGAFVAVGAAYDSSGCDDGTAFGPSPPCKRRQDNAGTGAAMLAVPVVGPFVAAAVWEDYSPGTAALLTLGSLQVLGAGALLAGLAWKHPVEAEAEAEPEPPQAMVVPMLAPGRAGIGVAGHF